MVSVHPALREILLNAYAPCASFAGRCGSMRWAPDAGHVPRGFCGAFGSLQDVALVLVVAEPGDPHVGETHPHMPSAALESTVKHAYECLRSGRDLFHRNIRTILDLCWPDLALDAQLRRTWITESVLCSARSEGAALPMRVASECRARFLDRQLDVLPHALVAALGAKAQQRLRGRQFIAAASVAPPGCNFRGARDSWHAIAQALCARTDCAVKGMESFDSE